MFYKMDCVRALKEIFEGLGYLKKGVTAGWRASMRRCHVSFVTGENFTWQKWQEGTPGGRLQ